MLFKIRKNFPELGTKVFIDKLEYTVTSLNIISKTVKVENDDDVKFLSLEDFKKQTGQTKFFRKSNNEKK